MSVGAAFPPFHAPTDPPTFSSHPLLPPLKKAIKT